MVTVDGEAMGGVMVTLTGDHAGDDNTMMTDADDGTYGFDGLRKGDYTVTITNPDAEAYSFPSHVAGGEPVGRTEAARRERSRVRG